MEIRISAHRHLQYSPELNHSHSYEVKPFHRARVAFISNYTKVEQLDAALNGLKAEAVAMADWIEAKHKEPVAFCVFLEPLEWSYFSHLIPDLRIERNLPPSCTTAAA